MNEIELRAELRRLMTQVSALIAHTNGNTVLRAKLTGARTWIKSAHDVIKVPELLEDE